MAFLGLFVGVEIGKRVKKQNYKRLNTPKMCPEKPSDLGVHSEKKSTQVPQNGKR
jgi:hypothetical protein